MGGGGGEREREGGGMELHTSCAHCMELRSQHVKWPGFIWTSATSFSLCTCACKALVHVHAMYTIIITRNNVDIKQGENLHVDINMLLSTHL